MVPQFRRFCRSVLTGIFTWSLIWSNAMGDEGAAPEGRGVYLGIFGGAGASTNNNINQSGTALFPDSQGGPLTVNAAGVGNGRGAAIGGLQIGHEWSGWWLSTDGNGWGLLPAAEFEGFYLSGSQSPILNNSTGRLPQHVFSDYFRMDSGVVLTNAVLSIQTPYHGLYPYIGAGVGAASVSINGATSTQVIPAEPGINHFNSGTSDSCWGFAAQAKAGVRIPLSERCWLFTEYRCLYVSSTNYVFGSTQYLTHVPTTPWNVHIGDMFNNIGVAGIGFGF